jgi:hypothetical protein
MGIRPKGEFIRTPPPSYIISPPSSLFGIFLKAKMALFKKKFFNNSLDKFLSDT